ncbi:MAG: amidohydrolase family protein [Luteitalea sp.]|nr:amidohydrolase family protein [Luteitalea sp.]
MQTPIPRAQTDRRSASLIVSGGTVVTMDERNRVLAPGAVAIDNGAIVAVDTPARIDAVFRAETRVDASDQIIVPGLVNTHTHAPMVLFRGLADDLVLMDWLQKYIFPAEAKAVSPELVRIGTELAALEMIESGTTTFADMYYFEEEIAATAKRAGLRAVLGQTIIGFPAPDAPTAQAALARAERFVNEWKRDAVITPAVAPHALYTNERATLTAARDLARKHHVPLLIHMAEAEAEVETAREKYQATPVGYLASIGFLGPNVLAAHCIWLTDEDIRTVAAADVGCAHNPESNMKLASGIAPVPKMLDEGVLVGLGTDGAASNNDLDMFEAMRQAAFLHKSATRDPEVIPARVALEMATLGGARALHMADRIGSLEPGKRADLIAVSTASARATPLYDPVSHLVYAAKGTDVRLTIVDGRVLMRDGEVVTLDEAQVLSAARRMAQKVREVTRAQ